MSTEAYIEKAKNELLDFVQQVMGAGGFKKFEHLDRVRENIEFLAQAALNNNEPKPF